MAALDAALEFGSDLRDLGSGTLKAFTSRQDDAERSVATDTTDRTIQLRRRVPLGDGQKDPSPPPISRQSGVHEPIAFGADTLQGFAMGAPPKGYPAPLSARAQSPRIGESHWDRSTRPKQQQSENVPPGQPLSQPSEWKISDDMLNQKWGTVLRTLQPAALDNNANDGSLSARLGHQDCHARSGVSTPLYGYSGGGHLSARPSGYGVRPGM
uniref:Uncharacterized protein n=1 Tax=Haptolina brevifila TaxID=156173 RepID=A0A7S2C7P4_9EUKA